MTVIVKRITIGFNQFVRRQTATSKYSYFSGTDEELIGLVEQNFPLRKKGNREGAWRVPVPPYIDETPYFFSAITKIHPYSFLNAECVSNPAPLLGNSHLISTSTVGPKTAGLYAEVILWSHELLAKTKQCSTDKDYEIVSIHVADQADQPEHPYEIARRVLGDPTTASEFTVEEVCKAIIYWGQRAFVKKDFRNHIDQQVASHIRNGLIPKAKLRRKEMCPQESEAQIQAYINAVSEFLAQTGAYYH